MSKQKTASDAKQPGVTQAPNPGWKPFLLARPVRNEAAKEGTLDQDYLPVTVLVDRPRWLVGPLAWMLPVSRQRTVKLDSLGRSIWDACTGQVRVGDIIDLLAEREQLTFHEARIAATQYIEELVRRGVLVLVVDERDKSG